MTCIIFNNTIVELLRIDFTNRWSKCRFAVVTHFNLLEIDNTRNMESSRRGVVNRFIELASILIAYGVVCIP